MANPSTSSFNEGGPFTPPDTVPFIFSCSCLNITVNAHISESQLDDETQDEKSLWLADGVEVEEIVSRRLSQSFVDWGLMALPLQKFPAYMAWEEGDNRLSRSGIEKEQIDESLISWRKCWICGVRCYEMKGKDKSAAPTGAWVTIRLDSGIHVSGPSFPRYIAHTHRRVPRWKISSRDSDFHYLS
jgi:hypothetical protein